MHSQFYIKKTVTKIKFSISNTTIETPRVNYGIIRQSKWLAILSKTTESNNISALEPL